MVSSEKLWLQYSKAPFWHPSNNTMHSEAISREDRQGHGHDNTSQLQHPDVRGKKPAERVLHEEYANTRPA